MDKKLSNKAKANLKILRLAIARGDSVKQTFKKLNVDVVYRASPFLAHV